MLNSPKSCSEIPFSSWDFDPLTPRDYTGEEHLHAYYNASVPNIKLPQTPTPPCAAQNIPAPDGFFGCLDITAANDWWAQNNTHFGLHEFDPYAPEMAEMDPNLDLAVYQDAVAIEQNIDIYQELLRLDPSVQLFDQGPWDEPGAWQPASDCSGYNSSSGSGGHTGVETSGSSVGFNTPGSSSGDSEAPEPLVISAPVRKSSTSDSSDGEPGETGEPAHSSSSSSSKKKRQRKRFTPELKKETHMTRITGACLPCWKNKKRCIRVSEACCKYCESIFSKIPNIPCFRARMTESELFRRGPTEEFLWTRRRWLKASPNDRSVWASPAKGFTITQGMGLTLNLMAKQYKPLPDDRDTYTWVANGGNVGALSCPPFAISDIDDAQRTINRYVEDNTIRYIQEHVSSNLILWESFSMALRMSNSKGSSLLRNALKLWVASRIIETPWSIVGTETFGMTPTMDEGSPYYGKTPVTPIMDFQIDNITIHQLLIPLRKKLLQELQKKVLNNKPEDFLEIYLTIFILLHNMELTIAHDRWFAMRYSLQNRFSNYHLIDAVFQGANILLAHFHHVSKGYAPFSVDWESGDTIVLAKSNEDEIRYMKDVIQATKQQESGLKLLKEKEMYEDSMYWCSQLFFPGWKPVSSPSP